MSLIAMMVGILSAIALYLLMSPQLGRWLYGFILLSSAVNISILLAGRVYLSQPAFVGGQLDMKFLGNPLPQALVLTAIVISFSLTAFVFIVLRILHKHQASMCDDRPEGTTFVNRSSHES